MTDMLKLLDKESARAILQGVKYIMMDVDGVLWSGTHVIPHVPETLQYLHNDLGKELRFLSNNASVSRQELLRNFTLRGMPNREAHEMYNSAYAAALRLQQLLGKPSSSVITADSTSSSSSLLGNDNNNKKEQLHECSEENDTMPLVHGNIFVIGEQGLCDEIQRVLAPGYITYGTELNDLNATGSPYTSHLLANAWTERILPAPFRRLVVCDGSTCRMVQSKSNNSSSVISKASVTEQSDNDANKISLSDLRPVAVVVGLDLHFNVLKLACASLILHGVPAHILPELLHHVNTQTDSDSIKKEEGEKTGIAKCIAEETEEIKRIRELYTRPLFIATNTDPQIPVGKPSVLVPGAGSMVNATSTCAGRTPDVICGKPFVDMANALFTNEHIHNQAETCLMIGDRLTTDIAFGNAAGCKTLLVLSGIEGMNEIEKAKADGHVHMLPNYIADSLAVFLPSHEEC